MRQDAGMAILETVPLARTDFVDWYRRNRARSAAIFDLLANEAYYSQPIALRHPIVFYEGHLPAFSFNTLVKRAVGGRSVDPRLEIDARRVAVEHNLEVVKRTAFGATIVNDGDEIEIVNFVGGGQSLVASHKSQVESHKS